MSEHGIKTVNSAKVTPGFFQCDKKCAIVTPFSVKSWKQKPCWPQLKHL